MEWHIRATETGHHARADCQDARQVQASICTSVGSQLRSSLMLTISDEPGPAHGLLQGSNVRPTVVKECVPSLLKSLHEEV